MVRHKQRGMETGPNCIKKTDCSAKESDTEGQRVTNEKLTLGRQRAHSMQSTLSFKTLDGNARRTPSSMHTVINEVLMRSSMQCTPS
jgi:hypothetical protein